MKLLLIHIQTQQRWTLIQEASMEFMPPCPLEHPLHPKALLHLSLISSLDTRN